ncbi:hypothetical protein [Chondromyces crocatus]|uniref:Methyltransferase domain-containing protein n=1 Tax=Chondromyces crocatus TaxID=52 RepID=A0A0K1E9S3_CHOCO|nr:hypothetical protein [Chondromyces crocatus]AKT37589.1 uncharacterized protein CMC5_017300 [Chondromyces crocatus]
MLVRTLHRGLARVHRATLRVERLLAEVAVALCPPGFERVAIDEHYDGASSYLSAQTLAAGLYPFERRALADWFPAPPARLFLPGAGGGRELLALLEHGYEVDALEPAPRLAEAARQRVAARALGARGAVRNEDLESWAARKRAGYDGIFTGWGVWSHLLRRDDRLAVLRRFREASPGGPVLLSFWRREPVFDPEERGASATGEGTSSSSGRLLSLTRHVLRGRILRLPPVEAGTIWRAGLYVHCVSEAELAEEAGLSGYRLVHYERDGSRYPNAVLVPRGVSEPPAAG